MKIEKVFLLIILPLALSCSQKQDKTIEANTAETTTDKADETSAMNLSGFPSPEEKESKPSVLEIDGIKCQVVEETKVAIRYSTTTKLSVEQIKKAREVLSIPSEKTIIQFCLPEKSKRGEEYASIDQNAIFLYDDNKAIDLKTGETINFN